jgi:rubrerythrin
MKHVVVHHAHHPDEGVYRLVHAEQHMEIYQEINPRWTPNPDLEGHNEPRLIEASRTTYHNPRDIVWADDDSRWEGMDPKDIATAQRQDVTEALARFAAAEEIGQREAQRVVHPIGTVGIEL